MTVRVLWDRFVSVVNEASRILTRAAFSPLVRESNDFACSLMTTGAETIAIADDALPSFASTQAYTLRACLDGDFPLERWRPGDVLITNDPWIGTAQIMDITLLKPVFRNGRLVCFTGSVAHNPDLGGVQRWIAATDVFEEGLQLPPVLLYREGVLDETLVTMIRANSRRPDLTMGDLMAQLASNEVAERRVLQMMDEYGLDHLDEVAGAILDRSERAMRRAVDELPDGEYAFAFQVDGHRSTFERASGLERAEPYDIVTRVLVAGSEITVDVSGSSPQVDAPVNAIYPFTLAYIAYTLRLLLLPNVPQNGGSLRPIRLVAEEGTVFNARWPAASLNRSVVGHPACNGVFGALAEVLPHRVQAMCGICPGWGFVLAGRDQWGRLFHLFTPIGGGLGASAEVDGEVAGFPYNYASLEIEILETTTPVLCEAKELRPDSGGPGRRRGGLGLRYALRARERMVFNLNFNRVHHPAAGLLGGLAGAPGRMWLGDRPLQPDTEGIVEAGELILLESPGGGGIGPPREREPERILRDLEEGLVTAEHARAEYGFSGA